MKPRNGRKWSRSPALSQIDALGGCGQGPLPVELLFDSAPTCKRRPWGQKPLARESSKDACCDLHRRYNGPRRATNGHLSTILARAEAASRRIAIAASRSAADRVHACRSDRQCARRVLPLANSRLVPSLMFVDCTGSILSVRATPADLAPISRLLCGQIFWRPQPRRLDGIARLPEVLTFRHPRVLP
jgi:hypothetical protein